MIGIERAGCVCVHVVAASGGSENWKMGGHVWEDSLRPAAVLKLGALSFSGSASTPNFYSLDRASQTTARL